MIKFMAQKGSGLMEVLVAMVILSIAILGFAALQMRAVNATDEALKRSDAIVILNGLAEKIRLNSSANYTVTIPSTVPACVASKNCSANNQALADLYNQSQIASAKGIQLGITNCPNTSTNQTRLCLLAAWNTTNPTIASGTTADNCIDSTTGKYISGSDCLLMEAY
ncbi:type IV pilus modification PilV family protein [Acinetobacter ursingii]|uniref:type IV pilus modification PilV family protein n=1 Tax=Acinetobacter ursingii TaxID=108980 RepID=UPI001D19628E|nr:prepilin-type N-terminal cleavage/methylation domain-containing protein [Acinetobacter ursingii]